MIRKYFNFKLFGLLESILVVDDQFRDIIKILSKGGDKVSKSLIMLFDEDIKTNINYIKASDKNDELNFVNDAQVKRFKDAGENPFSKTANVIKVGRAIRQLFNANNLPVSDPEIESFVNLYKNAWDKKFTKMDGFRLVNGSDIRYWYLEDNYVHGGGQLNASCMRYERCQPYLDIYVKNPDVCQLLVYVDKQNRLLGRAIVWKLTDKTRKCDYMLDRVYTRFDSDISKITTWFEEHFGVEEDEYHSHSNGFRGCSVTIKNKDFDTYPYADSLWVLDYADNKLLSYEGRKPERLQLHLQQTEGYAVAPGYKRSKRMNYLWIKQEDAVLIKSINDYLPISECGRDRRGNYIAKFESTYSSYYDAYIPNDLCIDTEEWGIVDKFDIVTVYDTIEDDKPSGSKRMIKSSDDFSNYKLVVFPNNVQMFINKLYVTFNVDRRQFVLKNSPGSKLFLVSKTEIKKILASKDDSMYSVFGEYFKLDNSEYYIPYGVIAENISTYNNSYFCTENSVSLFKIDTTNREFYLCNNTYRFYNWSVKEPLLKYIDALDIPTELKDSMKNEVVEADKYLIDNGFSFYIANKKLHEALKNNTIIDYVNNSIVDFFIKYDIVKNFDAIADKYAKYIYRNSSQQYHYFSNFDSFNYINREGKRVDISSFRKLDFDAIKKILDDFIQSYEYEIYLFAYYFIILNSKSYANAIIGNSLSKLNKNSPQAKTLVDIVFNLVISGEFFRGVNDIRATFTHNYAFATDKLFKDNGLSKSPYDFEQAYLDIFNDFYQKLFKTS